jgi:hypothetical protein
VPPAEQKRYEEFRHLESSMIKIRPLLVGTVGCIKAVCMLWIWVARIPGELPALIFGDFNSHRRPQRVALFLLQMAANEFNCVATAERS